MTNKENFDSFIGMLYRSAVEDYTSTDEYRLMHKNIKEIECVCSTSLSDEHKELIMESYELLLEIHKKSEYYIYKRGLSDSVKILKWTGVLE